MALAKAAKRAPDRRYNAHVTWAALDDLLREFTKWCKTGDTEEGGSTR